MFVHINVFEVCNNIHVRAIISRLVHNTGAAATLHGLMTFSFLLHMNNHTVHVLLVSDGQNRYLFPLHSKVSSFL